jgi:hypothetical protein
MSRSVIDKAFKCDRKIAYSNTPVGVAQANAAAKDIMRKDLRKAMVHFMNVYTCKYSGLNGEPVHVHVGTKASPFAVGYRGTNNARQWADEMGIEWTSEDEAMCQAVIRRWYADAQPRRA